ncbi:hypothetical protein BBC27_08810 [Acidithiobacillus ferrivorans]|uniref:Uncharacterized protein n=1 Tax=Acidithiobacillus ferrivorans TaxID=160808 RepID=A0A1B9BZT2_9PROT|nr:hypothetical protein BBC27_08810 [Acidithiobacillus ferrivorans]
MFQAEFRMRHHIHIALNGLCGKSVHFAATGSNPAPRLVGVAQLFTEGIEESLREMDFQVFSQTSRKIRDKVVARQRGHGNHFVLDNGGKFMTNWAQRVI